MKLLRLLILVVLFSSLTVLLSHPVFAQPQSNWMEGEGYDQSLLSCIAGGNTAECFIRFTSHGLMNSASMDIAGLSSDSINPDGTLKNSGFTRQMMQASLFGGVSRGIAMIYANPPADFGYWVADVGQTLGFIPKQAYAQGIGFSGLSPLLNVWKAFRNIAYLILAVIMIVIGFMVMLRKKIDPKTVVTVQNALPRIIITLILITFSYAIVGFLIDLMYLFILLVVAVVGPSLNIPGTDIASLQVAFTAGGASQIGRIFGALAPIAPAGGAGIAGGVLAIILGQPLVAALAILFGGFIAAFWPGGVPGGSALSLFSPLLLLLLALGMIVVFIRVLFILINAYIQIIISLVFGPVQIMLDAVPGGNGFASWLNNLIVNLLTFPLVISLIMIGASISSQISGSTFWQPPLVPQTPNSSQFIAALIGVGIVMSIPNIVKAVKEALKIKPLVPAGAGVLAQPLVGAAGGVLQIGTQFFYTSQLIGLGKGLLRKQEGKQ